MTSTTGGPLGKSNQPLGSSPTVAMSQFLQAQGQNVSTTPLFANFTATTHPPRRGIVFDKWPFRLDIPTEYQDWILVGVSCFLLCLWCLPCICGKMRNSCSRGFTSWIYTRLNIYFWAITYVNLALLMFVLGLLPDWTVNEYGEYLLAFITWVLLHLKKVIMSCAILAGFVILMKFQERIKVAAGLDHISMIHFNWRQSIGLSVRKRPIEVFIWKVEDIQSSTNKIYKPNDIYIECHLGDNEPMRTRVHNNAGTSSVMKESFQVNINESESATLMTLLVKDQALMVSTELGRLVLSTREVLAIEDRTGKRITSFTYSKENFEELSLVPRGKIWIAVAPVDDMDEDKKPLLRDDHATC